MRPCGRELLPGSMPIKQAGLGTCRSLFCQRHLKYSPRSKWSPWRQSGEETTAKFKHTASKTNCNPKLKHGKTSLSTQLGKKCRTLSFFRVELNRPSPSHPIQHRGGPGPLHARIACYCRLQ